MIERLDNILLSNNPTENFYKEYAKSDFKKWILSVLPEVEDCRKLKQDNPWHIYNCLDHILHSVEEINAQTLNLDFPTRRLIAYTMFLHDIGKPQCHLRRYSKLYKREVDSFFNHNLAGVKIANRALKSFGFNEKESEIIKVLIKEHDMFMFITLENNGNPHHRVLTSEYLNEKISELNKIGNGELLLKYLIKIGRSDNKSQNPEMTGKSLHLLDVMDNMLEKNHCKEK